MKRSELKRTAGLSPLSPKRKRAARQYAAARAAVKARSGGLCEVGCGGPGYHAHHRLRRSQGGPDTADNLLWCCASCHDRIHGNPEWAYRYGYMIRSAS